MLIIAVLPSILFPPKKPDSRLAARPDSTARLAPTAPESPATATQPSVSPTILPSAGAPAATAWVTSPLYRLGFTCRGGSLVRAVRLNYRSIANADTRRPGPSGRHGSPPLAHRRAGR